MANYSNNPGKGDSKMDYVEFTPPSDFKMPATTSENKEFDVVCTFRPKEGGKLCMVKLGQTAMPEPPEEKKEEKTEKSAEETGEMKPDYSKMANSIVSGVNEERGGMEGGYQ